MITLDIAQRNDVCFKLSSFYWYFHLCVSFWTDLVRVYILFRIRSLACFMSLLTSFLTSFPVLFRTHRTPKIKNGVLCLGFSYLGVSPYEGYGMLRLNCKCDQILSQICIYQCPYVCNAAFLRKRVILNGRRVFRTCKQSTFPAWHSGEFVGVSPWKHIVNERDTVSWVWEAFQSGIETLSRTLPLHESGTRWLQLIAINPQNQGESCLAPYVAMINMYI